MSVPKRFIRLKELPNSAQGQFEPSDAYLEATDGSLAKVPFAWSTDADGFLQTENSTIRGHTLFLLGDSFVESMFAAPKERFASRLERRFRTDGLAVDVRNAGYSGSTTLQMFNVLVNKVAAIADPADLVLLCFPHSDGSAFIGGGGYWGTTDRYATILPAAARQQSVRDRGVADLRALARLVAAAGAALGLRLAFATSPFRRGDFSHDAFLRRIYRRDRARFDTMTRFRHRMNETVSGVAQEAGVPCFDIDGWLEQRPDLLYDELHLNASGHRAVADFLAEELLPLFPHASTD